MDLIFVQYKDNISIANKIGKTLRDLFLAQHYNPLLGLIEREERKNIWVNSSNEEIYNISFSMGQLTSGIKTTYNCEHYPEDIHRAILKRLPPKGFVTLLDIYTTIRQQECKYQNLEEIEEPLKIPTDSTDKGSMYSYW